MGKLRDLTGQRFGRLVVIERCGSYKSPDGFSTAAKWRCVCDCGNETAVISNSLLHGYTKSCGCLQRENAATMVKKRWGKK